MLTQRDNFFWYKLNGVLRSFIVRGGCSIFFNHITVNEYPKSGGTWIAQMLSEAIELPFPRNRLPMFRDSIMHGHYLSTFRMHNVVVVWRDARDVVVSQYYHWLFGNEITGDAHAKKCRYDLQFTDYEDIFANLPAFIDYVYIQKEQPRFSWSDFVNSWHNSGSVFVKYEDMRQNSVKELQRIVFESTGNTLEEKRSIDIVEKFSFAKQSGRKCGQENKNSFMRKGIVGDWKNNFSDEAAAKIKQYAGHELIKLGYETSLSW